MPPVYHSLASLSFSQWENLHFLVALRDTANCATAQSSVCLHATPGQQRKAAQGQAQLGLQESLAAALKGSSGRWCHPRSLLEHENQAFLFLFISALSTPMWCLHCLCVTFHCLSCCLFTVHWGRDSRPVYKTGVYSMKSYV